MTSEKKTSHDTATVNSHRTSMVDEMRAEFAAAQVRRDTSKTKKDEDDV